MSNKINYKGVHLYNFLTAFFEGITGSDFKGKIYNKRPIFYGITILKLP